MTRERPRRSSVGRKWTTTRVHLTCASGHSIRAGEPALFVRVAHLRYVWCAPCAWLQYAETPPPPKPFELKEPPDVDVKLRAAGEN